MDAQSRRGGVMALVESIVGRPVESIDVDGMTLDERRKVSADAVAALRNPVLVAIFGKSSRAWNGEETSGMAVDSMVKDIARAAKSYDEVEALRNTIVGIEYVKRALVELSFADPASRQASEPFAAI